MESGEIDGVVIATPAETHFDIARQALEAGKHVFVEKPLALSVKEGEDLCRLARGKNIRLMVGHVLLYHPAIIELKKIIDSGELGKIQYVYSNRLNLEKLWLKRALALGLTLRLFAVIRLVVMPLSAPALL